MISKLIGGAGIFFITPWKTLFELSEHRTFFIGVFPQQSFREEDP